MLVLLLLGVLVGRLRVMPDGTAGALDAVVINLSLPGLVLALVPTLELDSRAAVPVAVAWAALVVLAGAVLALGRALGWDRRVLGTMLLVVPLGNTSFLGIPAVEALLGRDHLPYAIIYDQLGSFLALTTYGAVIAGRYGGATTPDLRATVRNVVTFPPFVALVAALVLRTTGLPAVVEDVAGRLGDTVVPLTMVAVGMRLTVPRRGPAMVPLAAGLGLRMLVAPALAFGAALLLGGTGIAWDTSVLEAAMPPMVTAAVVATDAGLDERLAANLVALGVIAAMATLPAWALLLR